MATAQGEALPWAKLAAEFAGTAVLLLLGLSIVILLFGAGSPLDPYLPAGKGRMALSGFLFGCVGGSIALSRVGRVSGAHINPAVTFAFWFMGKMEPRVALGYIAAQLAGAIAGCLPLVAFGDLGRSLAFGATIPGKGFSVSDALLGEAVTTFGLVSTLCIFIGFRTLRRFTPFTMPVLYGLMVPLEAPISGTSTNPARSLGPSVISGQWEGWWIYWAGPLLGTIASLIVFSFLGKRIEEAKLYHFESDRRKVFRTKDRTPAT